MRILLTGCTGIQVRAKRRRKNTFVTLYLVLGPALEELGHEVDWRPVKCGEPLKGKYDLAIVGVAAMHGFVTMNHKWGALWAASQLPHVVAFDDWQVEGVCGTIRDHSLWNLGVVDYVAYQNAYKYRDVIEGQRAQWAAGMRHVLAPLFNWGDRGEFHALHPIGELHGWDPSPLVEMPPLKAAAKERRWVCAALASKEAWLKKLPLSWPVERRFNGALPRLTEEQLVGESYASAWGVLSPAYRAIDGAGWWRARFGFAAHAGSVLWGDPKEMAPLGGPYAVPLEVVEGMSDASLARLALEQRDLLESWQYPRAKALAELDAALSRVVATA